MRWWIGICLVWVGLGWQQPRAQAPTTPASLTPAEGTVRTLLLQTGGTNQTIVVIESVTLPTGFTNDYFNYARNGSLSPYNHVTTFTTDDNWGLNIRTVSGFQTGDRLEWSPPALGEGHISQTNLGMGNGTSPTLVPRFHQQPGNELNFGTTDPPSNTNILDAIQLANNDDNKWDMAFLFNASFPSAITAPVQLSGNTATPGLQTYPLWTRNVANNARTAFSLLRRGVITRPFNYSQFRGTAGTTYTFLGAEYQNVPNDLRQAFVRDMFAGWVFRPDPNNLQAGTRVVNFEWSDTRTSVPAADRINFNFTITINVLPPVTAPPVLLNVAGRNFDFLPSGSTVNEDDAMSPVRTAPQLFSELTLTTDYTVPATNQITRLALLNTTNAAAGTWQYRRGGSSGTWTTVPGLSSTSSVFPLRDDDELRFLPVADWNGDVSLVYRLYSPVELNYPLATATSAVMVGNVANASPTPSSPDALQLDLARTGNITLRVTPVQDAPVLTTKSTQLTTDELPVGNQQEYSAADLTATNLGITDVDISSGSPPNLYAVIEVFAPTGSGSWQYGGGGSWTSLTLAGNQFLAVGDTPAGRATATEIRFQPTNYYSNSGGGAMPYIVVRALDQTYTTNRTRVGNTSIFNGNMPVGGGSPLSVDSETLLLTVQEINQPPSFTLRGVAHDLSMARETEVLTGLSLSSFASVTYDDDGAGGDAPLPAVYVDSDGILDGTIDDDLVINLTMSELFTAPIDPGAGDVSPTLTLMASSVDVVRNFDNPSNTSLSDFFTSSTPSDIVQGFGTSAGTRFSLNSPTPDTHFSTGAIWNSMRLRIRIRPAVSGVVRIALRARDNGMPQQELTRSFYLILRNRVRPRIISRTPPDTDLSSRSPDLRITFNEPITLKNPANREFVLRDNDNMEVYRTALNASNVSLVDGNATLLIRLSTATPSVTLKKSSIFRANLDSDMATLARSIDPTILSALSARIPGLNAPTLPFLASMSGPRSFASDSPTWWVLVSPDDGSPPMVIRTVPVDGAMGIALQDDVIRLTFDENVELNAARPSLGVVIEQEASGGTFSAVETVEQSRITQPTSSGDVYSVNNGIFPSNARVRVTVQEGLFVNRGGSVESAQHIFFFNTVTGASFVAASSVPASGATNVVGGDGTSATKIITARYTSHVAIGTGSVTIEARPVGGTNYAVLQTIPVPSPSSITTDNVVGGQGGLRIALPTPFLSGNNEYRVLITSGAVTSAGSSLVGAHQWTFTTVAAEAGRTNPSVLRVVTPADGASNVPISGNLVFEMTELVKTGPGGNIEIYLDHGSGNTELYRSIPSSSSSVSINLNRVTVAYGNADGTQGTRLATSAYDDNLPGGSNFYVLVTAGAFDDLSSQVNGSDAQTGATFWDFSTASTNDNRSPTFESVEVVLDGTDYNTISNNRVINVPISRPYVHVTFDEPVQAGTGSISIQEVGGSANWSLSVTGPDVSFSGRTVIFRATTDFDYGKMYQYTIPANAVRDRTGRNLSAQVQREIQTILDQPVFAEDEVVSVLDNTSDFTAGSSNTFTPTDNTPFDLTSDATVFSSLRWYASEADANANTNVLFTGANPKYGDLITGVSSTTNVITSTQDIGIYPFWVRQAGTTTSRVKKIRLVLLAQDHISIFEIVSGGTPTELSATTMLSFPQSSTNTYQLRFPINDAAGSSYTADWFSYAGGVAYNPGNETAGDGVTAASYLPQGTDVMVGSSSRTANLVVTIRRNGEEYSLDRQVVVVKSAAFVLQVDRAVADPFLGNTQVCQGSGTLDLATSTYSDAGFVELTSGVSGLLSGTASMTDWAINTNAVNSVSTSVSLPIERYSNRGSGALISGTSSITMFQAPELSFTNVRSRYCVNDADADVEILIRNDAPGSNRRRKSNTTTASEALNGELEIYVRTDLMQAISSLTPQMITGTALHSFRLAPRTLYGSNTADAVYVRFVYTSAAAEDVGGKGCTNSTTVDFVIYKLPAAPAIDYMTNNEVYCKDDALGDIAISSPVSGATYRWYRSAVSMRGSGPFVAGTTLSAADYTAKVNTSVAGTYTMYATRIGNVFSGFAGCESNVQTATITVEDRPSVSLTPTMPTSVCIGTEVTVDGGIPASPSGSYNVSYQIDEILADGTLSSQHGTAFKNAALITQADAHAPVVLRTQYVASIFDSDVNPSQESTWTATDFVSTSVNVSYNYEETLSDGGTCASVVQRVRVTINPRPVVSVQGIAKKNCQSDPETQIFVNVGGGGSPAWSPSSSSSLGTVSLLKDDGSGTYVDQGTSFRDASGRFIFSSQTGEEGEVFRLRYTSAPSQDGARCTNEMDFDFRIYPRPPTPTVMHASGGVRDEYCGSGATIQDVSITTSTLPTPGAGELITHRFHSLSSGTGATRIGAGTILLSDPDPTDGVSFEPTASPSVPGNYNYYADVVRYAETTAGGFSGCASYVEEIEVRVISAPAINFQTQLNGSTSEVGQVCIGTVNPSDGSGTSNNGVVNQVNLVMASTSASPSDIVNGATLGTTASLAFSFRDPDAPSMELTDLTAELTNANQASGTVVTNASFNTLDIIKELEGNNMLVVRSASISERIVLLRAVYTITSSTGSCTAQAEKSLVIRPLPVFSIASLAEKNCVSSPSAQLAITRGTGAGASTRAYSSAIGTMTLLQHNSTSGAYSTFMNDDANYAEVNPTGVSMTSNNTLNFDAGQLLFENQTGNARRVFRLVYNSNSSATTDGCTNQATYDFTIYPSATAPTVSNPTERYCAGSSVRPFNVDISGDPPGSTYAWYGFTVGAGSARRGSGSPFVVTAPGSTFTPASLSTNTPGTSRFYVSTITYKDGSFAGCEGPVTEVSAEVLAAIQVNFEFRFPGATRSEAQSCIGTVNASGEYVNESVEVAILPATGASLPSVGSALRTGESVEFSFVSGSPPTPNAALNALLSDRVQSTVGDNVEVASFTSLAVLRNVLSNPSLAFDGSFTPQDVTMQMVYTASSGCSATLSSELTINPLPDVSIQGFAEKHCQTAEDEQIQVSVGSDVRNFRSSAGTLELFRSNATSGTYPFSSTTYVQPNASNPRLNIDNGRLLFENQTGDERRIFRLLYISSPGSTDTECVNRTTHDFTIYPRPSAPTVTNPTENYCAGLSATTPFEVDVQPNTTYTWYSSSSGTGAMRRGTSTITTGNTYIPTSLNTNNQGTTNFYVSATAYGDSPFMGCESFVTEVSAEVLAAIQVDFQFRRAGETESIPQSCIGTVNASGGYVDESVEVAIVPTSGASSPNVGDALGTDASLSFSFVSGSPPTPNAALNALLSDRVQNTAGEDIEAASFTSLAVLRNVLSNPSLAFDDDFAPQSVTMQMTYAPSLGCNAVVSRNLTINPLPEVSIENLAEKHCQTASPHQLQVKVVPHGGTGVTTNFRPSAGLGTMTLLRSSAGAGVSPPYAAATYTEPNASDPTKDNISNDGSLLFVNQAGSTLPVFRLRYISARSSSSVCANVTTMDFTIYERPSSPSLEESTLRYCEGTPSADAAPFRIASPVSGAIYNWYGVDAATGPSGSLVASTARGRGGVDVVEYTPPGVIFTTSPTNPAERREYVSITRHASGGFGGCESYLQPFITKIEPRPTFEIQFREGTEAVSRICIGDGLAGTPSTIGIIPGTGAPSVGNPLPSGDELAYAFDHSTASTATDLSALIQNATQTSGNVQEATFDVFEAVKILVSSEGGSLSNLGDLSSQENLNVHAFYTTSTVNDVSGTSVSLASACRIQTSRRINVLPLPQVSIENFNDRYCRGAAPISLQYDHSSGSATQTWDGASSNGEFVLQWRNGANYRAVTNFLDGAQLDFDEVFDENAALTALGMEPSADPNFRLIYRASPMQYSDGCTNVASLDFAIVDAPPVPNVEEAAAATPELFNASNSYTRSYCHPQGDDPVVSVRISNPLVTYSYAWFPTGETPPTTTSPGGDGYAISVPEGTTFTDGVARLAYSVIAHDGGSSSTTRCASAPRNFIIQVLQSAGVRIESIKEFLAASAEDPEMIRTINVSNTSTETDVCVASIAGSGNSRRRRTPEFQFNVEVRNATGSTSGTFAVNGGIPEAAMRPDNSNPSLFRYTLIPSGAGGVEITFSQNNVITFTQANGNPGSLECPTHLVHTINVNPLPQANFSSSGILSLDGSSADVCVLHPTSTIELPFVRGSRVDELTIGTENGTENIPNPVSGREDFNPLQQRRTHFGERTSNDNMSRYNAATQHSITIFVVDENGCQNFREKTITIHPVPDIEIVTDTECPSTEVSVGADVKNIAQLTEPLSYNWEVTGRDIGANSTLPSFTLTGLNPGESSNVELTVITAATCSSMEEKAAAAGQLPEPTIVYDGRPLEDEAITFHTYESELSLDDIEETRIDFYKLGSTTPVGAGAVRSISTQFFANLTQTFNEAGVYKAIFLVDGTVEGCQKADTLFFQVLPPIIEVSTGVPYTEEFDATRGNWYIDSVRFERSSPGPTKPGINIWERRKLENSINWGVPDPSAQLIRVTEEMGKVWSSEVRSSSTDPELGLRNDDRSLLYSPIFNVSNLERPTLSFNLIHDFRAASSGLVLQYSPDGVTWYALGDYEDARGSTGLNWYNARSLSSDPGGQVNQNITGNRRTESVGWSKQDDVEDDQERLREVRWRTSIHRLDAIPVAERANVQFRFAIGVNNNDIEVGEGVGIDDFAIYERTKVILVEEFSSILTEEAADIHGTINGMVDPEPSSSSELLKISYFGYVTGSNGQDPLYRAAAQDVNARQLFYGVEDIPSSVVDGDYSNNIDAPAGELGWSATTVGRAALSPPYVQLEIGGLEVGDDAQLNLRVEIKSSTDAQVSALPPGNYRLRLALIERVVNFPETPGGGLDFRHVLRKLMPTAAGLSVDLTPFYAEGAEAKDTIEVPPVPLYDLYFGGKRNLADLGLYVIAFVQNEDTREVLQSTVGEITGNSSLISFGVDDNELREGISVYPNPLEAGNSLEIRFDILPAEDLSWRLLDLNGTMHSKGVIGRGSRTHTIKPKAVFAEGVYYLVMHQKDKTIFSTKILVKGKN